MLLLPFMDSAAPLLDSTVELALRIGLSDIGRAWIFTLPLVPPYFICIPLIASCVLAKVDLLLALGKFVCISDTLEDSGGACNSSHVVKTIVACSFAFSLWVCLHFTTCPLIHLLRGAG
mmetsp:Transcript_8236/g.21597  ORF Transcript_8236/g.21597 Transcript_8236/m.21597 type:complete len:119 (-) Transcript_8236:59-415(-)